MRYNVYRGGTLLNPVPTAGPPFDNLLLPSNTEFNYYVTAVNDDGIESLPSAIVLGRTDTDPLPGGGTSTQNLYEYNFQSAPNTTPSSLFGSYVLKNTAGQTGTFTTETLPWFVAFGVAQPGAATTDGYRYTIAPYYLDQGSRDHAAEVTMAIGAGNQVSGDRSVMPIVRCDGTGDNWVGAVSHWGPGNCQILTCINRVITVRASQTAVALTDNDRFRLTADGPNYVAQRISGANGAVTDMCTWLDEATVYPFANRRSGFAFQHVRSGGSNWAPPGMTLWWRGGDLRATQNVDFLNAWILAFFGLQTWPALTGPATTARGIALTSKRRKKVTQ